MLQLSLDKIRSFLGNLSGSHDLDAADILRPNGIIANGILRLTHMGLQESLQFCQFGRQEQAFKDTVLNALSVILERFGNFRPSFIVGDIVTDDNKLFSHPGYLIVKGT
jgi:hypothetical protein